MNDKTIYALSATVYSVIFLVGMIVYGGDSSRGLALAASLFACMSQFVGQDPHPKVRIASICLAYVAFILSVIGLTYFAIGV